ncbi:MAG: hypothetical protein ACPGVG_14160 [Mycobacterium sp.]
MSKVLLFQNGRVVDAMTLRNTPRGAEDVGLQQKPETLKKPDQPESAKPVTPKD